MSQAFRNMNRSNNAPATQQENGPQNFPAMLKQYHAELARALPQHINADRMSRIALTAFRQTPKLAKCDPRSVFAAVIQSSQLGLEVGLMGEAHLVPFGDQCQLIPGYTGLMKLARQSGQVIDIYAHEVRLKDKFKLLYGLDRSLEHEPLKSDGGFPAHEDERGPVTGFYAVAVLKDGTKTFVAMSVHDVNRIRDNSKGYQSAKKYNRDSTWDTDYVPMGLKTVIRGLCKFLPKSPELQMAMALDNAAHNGKEQNLNLDDVISGSYTVVEDDEDTGGSATQAPSPAAQPSATAGSQQQSQMETPPPSHSKPESKAAVQNTVSTGKSESAEKREPLTAIEKACAALQDVKSVEELDHVYLFNEEHFEGQDLEVLLRKYREVKTAILGSSQGSLV